MKALHALAVTRGDLVSVVVAVCAKCRADFHRDAPIFAAFGLRLVDVRDRAIVRQLRRNAERKGVSGCAGCVMDGAAGRLSLTRGEPLSAAHIAFAGGDA